MNRKYVVILGDGMSDYADERGNTPLTEAEKPCIDKIASCSEVGLIKTVPDGMKPGSDTANLSVMGYDPRIYYTGRSPLEAVSMGIPLTLESVTYRCNLVTLSDEPEYSQKSMKDYSSGEITTDEARVLIAFLKEELDIPLYAGVSYRHCLALSGIPAGTKLTPPHDITGKRIADYLPDGPMANELLSIMERSYRLLKNHPVNKKRVSRGKNPANSVWLWGEGKKPALKSFSEEYGINGAVISAVDLIKGIGICAGLKIIEVPGATGTVDTNFDGKAEAAMAALKDNDFLYVHLEAPDECGHQGDRANKIRAIELIDRKIVRPIKRCLEQSGSPYRLAVLPDHATPLSLMTHVSDPVPYILFDSEKKFDGPARYDEFSAKQTGFKIEEGHTLMKRLIGK